MAEASFNKIAPDDRALDKREFCEILGIAPSTLYERIARGQIPPPLRLLGARSSRWLLSDAQAILAAAAAQRVAHPACAKKKPQPEAPAPTAMKRARRAREVA